MNGSIFVKQKQIETATTREKGDHVWHIIISSFPLLIVIHFDYFWFFWFCLVKMTFKPNFPFIDWFHYNFLNFQFLLFTKKNTWKHSHSCYRRVPNQPQIPAQMRQQINQAVGQAVTNAAVNELTSVFASKFK